MSREYYSHEVDLGRPVSPEQLQQQLREEGDQDIVRGILQMIRTQAAEYRADAHDLLVEDKDNAAKLKLGAAQSLDHLFWAIVQDTPLVGVLDE